MLSNEKRRAHFDKYGTVEGDEEDMTDMADFMEEMLNSFFGKGSKGGKDPFDDFEDLVTMLEKGSEKETRKMFRELG